AMLTIVVFIGFSETLISLFVAESEPEREAIFEIGVVLLALAALFQLVDGWQAVALGLLRGVQDTLVPAFYAAFSYWIVGMPVAYVLGFELGWDGVGIWLGLVVGLLCAAVLLLFRFWRSSVPRIAAMA
ncbi:MAG: MATE family efflux transporter, partial [Pseudomonadota bacterium]